MSLCNVGDVVICTIDKVISDQLYRGSLYKKGVFQSIGTTAVEFRNLRNKKAIKGDVVIVKVININKDLGIVVVNENEVSYDELLLFTKSYVGTSILAN